LDINKLAAIMERRYDIAKNEYQAEDDDGRHRLVYAYFGLAIYLGQCLEETFSIMLWTDRIFKKKVKTNEEVTEIIDAIENSKKTMGNFINEVKKSYSLTTSIVDQLDKILDTRNYLAHKYFKLHIEKFHSEIGQLEMIKYFCDFTDDSKQLDEQLKTYYTKYTDKLGLTDEKIEQLMIEMKEQEIKRTKND
jgi:uncharacterized protein with HEPN domain